MEVFRILVVNPGSTSTKIALYENDKEVLAQNIHHTESDLAGRQKISEQYPYRMQVIESFLVQNGIEPESLAAVVGRGGLLHPMAGGTFAVNEKMVQGLTEQKQGEHASNLGGLIAYAFSQKLNLPAFIVDPVVVDEMADIARLSGAPELPRKSIFHALNQKAVARKAATVLGTDYDKANFVVAHLGGGISVGAHRLGQVIDVNNALDGEGPFTPERSGTLPVGDLARLCYQNPGNEIRILRMIRGKGGMIAYLGTNDMKEVKRRIAAGDQQALLVYQGMAYQVAKEIGAMAAVLKGQVDAIVLTGGIAHDEEFSQWIKQYVEFIARVLVFPGEGELEALAYGALRVLRGEEKAQVYS